DDLDREADPEGAHARELAEIGAQGRRAALVRRATGDRVRGGARGRPRRPARLRPRLARRLARDVAHGGALQRSGTLVQTASNRRASSEPLSRSHASPVWPWSSGLTMQTRKAAASSDQAGSSTG